MMWRKAAVAVMVMLAGCGDLAGPDPQPANQFGALTAVINGRAWTSSPYPDSLVAFQDAPTGELQILGQDAGTQRFRALRIRLHNSSHAGAFHLGTGNDPVYAEWFERGGAGRSREGAGRLRGYISSGELADSLLIDELSLSAGTIAGRFSFLGLEPQGTGRVRVRGRFAGRLVTIQAGLLQDPR